MAALERFIHDESAPLPALVSAAIAHVQFETIHPFLDGNGRLGRLLIALLLHERRVLSQPLLYLSLYLKGNRLEYYDRLTAVRKNGDWEGWTQFFLKGIEQTALEAIETAKKIISFREQAIRTASSLGSTEAKLLEFLFEHPLTDIQTAQKKLDVSYNTSAGAIAKLATVNLVREITGKQRNRIFRFTAYLELFEESA